MLYHASQVPNIKILEPRVSNHNQEFVYLSQKRENVLVYLSNAIEKFCKETNFKHEGIWHKWASYGFTKDGIINLEEYYENALEETFKNVKGYIYYVEKGEDVKPLKDIPQAYVSPSSVPVIYCEEILDAYKEILKAEQKGLIKITRYKELTDKKHEWLKNIIKKEYEETEAEEYKYFLENKFANILK